MVLKRKLNTTETNLNKKFTADVQEMEDSNYREGGEVNEEGEEDYSDYSDFEEIFGDDDNNERTLTENENVEENINDINEFETTKLMVEEGNYF
jgi:hypothetical protein